MNNKKTVTKNIMWRFSERVLAQLVALVVSIVLARILNPDVYGTVALIAVFTRILQVFVDSGLGNALIQKKGADDVDFSTVFYVNIFFCLIIYFLIFLFAPTIALFYGDQAMIPYIRVLGLTVLISGIKNVQQAYVSKHLLFRKFFFSTLGGTIIAGIIGVYMALNGFEIWALIAQQVINLLIDTIILWITVEWRPSRTFSINRLKRLYGFGWKLLGSALIDTVYNEARQLLIGKIYNASDLAFYNQGERFPKIIVENIDTSIDSVLLPTMSEEQDNTNRVKTMMRRSIQVSMYFLAPLMIGLASVSEPLIRILLTEKWLPTLPYLVIFCISFMFYPIHTANLNAIKAMGRSDLFLKLEIAKKVIGLALLCITAPISVLAMAYSLLGSAVTSQIINSWPNKKLLNYPYIEQIKDIFPEILLSVFMGGCVYWLKYLPIHLPIVLVVQVVLGAAIYLAGSALLKLEVYLYIIDTLKRYKQNKTV